VNVENYIIRKFFVCNPKYSAAELDDDSLGETCGACGVRRLIHTGMWWENLKEKDERVCFWLLFTSI
jgi:hypothetical protein